MKRSPASDPRATTVDRAPALRIGARWVDATSAGTRPLVDPASGETIGALRRETLLSWRRDPSGQNGQMGWAYLVVSINGAAYTLNALRPVRRSRLLFGWSFFASWVTIELAPFHLIWQVLATAVFARKGALRTTAGREIGRAHV